MEWREVVEHPGLQDLPFKIETNAEGYVIMTPERGKHGIYQSLIVRALGRLAREGRISTECPIQTSEGTRVADVAWGSSAFFRKNMEDDNPHPESPELAVEVKSPSNSETAMKRKAADGNIRFFHPRGELGRSTLFRTFPPRVEIDLG